MSNAFTSKAKKSKPKVGMAAKAEAKRTQQDSKKVSPFTKRAGKKHLGKAVEGGQTRGHLHDGFAKADFHIDGIKFTNPRDHGDFWTVDVVNGDEVFTFHNKHSSWFMDTTDNIMKEPVAAINFNIQKRYVDELRRVGAQLPYAYRTEEEKNPKKAKKKAAAKPAPEPVKKSSPWGKKKGKKS